MVQDGLSDAALILMGHGTVLNAESGAPVYRHAAELRRRRLFAEVHEAFWKQPPLVSDVLGACTAPRIFLVPLFISEGYFVNQMIPLELGLRRPGQDDFPRFQRRGRQGLYYCQPVGTHGSMTRVIRARAGEAVAKHPFPNAPPPADTALFIAGHGTDKNENSRQPIERQVEWIGALNEYAEVHAVFLEEDPRIDQCYRLAACKNLVMVPFFISDGLHVQEDIPVLLGEPKLQVRARLKNGLAPWRNPTERQGKRVWLASSVGSEPLLAQVILERVTEAVGLA